MAERLDPFRSCELRLLPIFTSLRVHEDRRLISMDHPAKSNHPNAPTARRDASWQFSNDSSETETFIGVKPH